MPKPVFAMEVRVSEQDERMVIFPVSRGIFGVGRLATRLTELAAGHQIGEWHIGHWVDWKHTAIRINFETVEDAALAKSACHDAATATS
jgi:hypothetical protein